MFYYTKKMMHVWKRTKHFFFQTQSTQLLNDFTIKTHWSDQHCQKVVVLTSSMEEAQWFVLRRVAWMDAWVINLYKKTKMACVYRPGWKFLSRWCIACSITMPQRPRNSNFSFLKNDLKSLVKLPPLNEVSALHWKPEKKGCSAYWNIVCELG